MDNESEDFQLLPLNAITTLMKKGEFKPNCAAVMIDFLIRHGHFEEDGSGDIIKIQQRLHRTFDFPV